MITFSLILIYSAYIIARKFGYKGWEFFIPFYNFAIMLEIITGKKKMALLLLLWFIPVVGWIAVSVLLIIWWWKLAGKINEIYQGNIWLIFLFGFIVIPIYVMRDCANNDDIISKKISSLFASLSSSEDLSESAVEPDASVMAFKYCKYCGKKILANSTFCSECGERLIVKEQ